MTSRESLKSPTSQVLADSEVERMDRLPALPSSDEFLPWRSLAGVSSSALSEDSFLTPELADAIRASYGIQAPKWGDAWMAVLCGLERVARLNIRHEVKLPCTFRVWFSLAPTLISVSEIYFHKRPNAETTYLFALASATPTP